MIKINPQAWDRKGGKNIKRPIDFHKEMQSRPNQKAKSSAKEGHWVNSEGMHHIGAGRMIQF